MTIQRAPSPSIRQFVKNAWFLLGFQLLVALAAVAVTAWAALSVRPLLEQRDRLASQIGELERDKAAASQEVRDLEAERAKLASELDGARAATPALVEAINAFHRRDYDRAISKYDDAIRLNPGDPYIYNLKSYSQFRQGDVQGAIRTMSRALELDPNYEWGYFDLARYQCAAGTPEEALRTIRDAIESRGAGVRKLLQFFLEQDGEFRNRCSAVLKQLRELATAQSE